MEKYIHYWESKKAKVLFNSLNTTVDEELVKMSQSIGNNLIETAKKYIKEISEQERNLLLAISPLNSERTQ